MNFKRNFVLWSVLLIAKQYVLAVDRECVQRRLGACKAQIVEHLYYDFDTRIWLDDFQSPQPEGFALKTSIEINLLANKNSFEKNQPVETKRPVGYNLDNAAQVTITIEGVGYSISIHLGKKHYRLAEFYCYNEITQIGEWKYNRYTPISPTFPYNLI